MSGDLIAGITMAIIQIPQGNFSLFVIRNDYNFFTIFIYYRNIWIRNAKLIGMAYGLLANVPPVLGIYTSIFPVLIYSILGPSSHVSKGRNNTNINEIFIV